MTFPADPAERQPKGDHNRRLSLGLDPEQMAEAAGISVEELREYERTSPDHDFDVDVAARVGEALERLEKLIPNSEPAGVSVSLSGRSLDEVLDQDASEQSLREAAYALWESDGRPEGRDLEYWYRAIENAGRNTMPADLVPEDEARERAFEASRKIGLQRGFRKSPDETVSGGFNQKANVATGTLNRPDGSLEGLPTPSAAKDPEA